MYRNSSSDAVHVAVYFESYCPDSIHFITQVLYPTWAKLKDTNVMKVTLFPYGKATVSIVQFLFLFFFFK